MSQDAAQTGASNASDFQPTTQNPQSVPVNLFQQQGSSQTVTNPQEFLNEQKASQIKVPTSPAPAAPEVARANESALVFVLIVGLVLFVVVFSVLSRKFRKTGPGQIVATPDSIAVTEVEKVDPAVVTDDSSNKPSKAVPKKKSVKKAKRRNR